MTLAEKIFNCFKDNESFSLKRGIPAKLLINRRKQLELVFMRK